MGQNSAPDDDREEEEGGTKGNKKGAPILWSFFKNTSMIITVCIFLIMSVLILDAYKFVSIRHAKFVRAKIFHSIQSLDPTIIESYTGMKIMPQSEYNQLLADHDKFTREARRINADAQFKFAQIVETSMAIEKMTKEMDDLKELIAEKEGGGGGENITTTAAKNNNTAVIQEKEEEEEEKKKVDDTVVAMVGNTTNE